MKNWIYFAILVIAAGHATYAAADPELEPAAEPAFASGNSAPTELNCTQLVTKNEIRWSKATFSQIAADQNHVTFTVFDSYARPYPLNGTFYQATSAARYYQIPAGGALGYNIISVFNPGKDGAFKVSISSDPRLVSAENRQHDEFTCQQP